MLDTNALTGPSQTRPGAPQCFGAPARTVVRCNVEYHNIHQQAVVILNVLRVHLDDTILGGLLPTSVHEALVVGLQFESLPIDRSERGSLSQMAEVYARVRWHIQLIKLAANTCVIGLS